MTIKRLLLALSVAYSRKYQSLLCFGLNTKMNVPFPKLAKSQQLLPCPAKETNIKLSSLHHPSQGDLRNKHKETKLGLTYLV